MAYKKSLRRASLMLNCWILIWRFFHCQLIPHNVRNNGLQKEFISFVGLGCAFLYSKIYIVFIDNVNRNYSKEIHIQISHDKLRWRKKKVLMKMNRQEEESGWETSGVTKGNLKRYKPQKGQKTLKPKTGEGTSYMGTMIITARRGRWLWLYKS